MVGAALAALAAVVLPRRRVVALALCAGLAWVACLALAWALVGLDFSLTYVADTTSRATAAPLRVAGLWGANSGSLLFFAAMLTTVAVVGLRRADDSAGVAVRAAAAVGAVLLATVVLLANPFERATTPPLDGTGLVPILRHPAMLYHPPLLYLGLTLTVVPFASTLAALVLWTPTAVYRRGRPQKGESGLDRAWLAGATRWALASWSVLTIAMAAGARWAYAEAGWGGFWAWDPIENGVLLPWLALTAFVHAARSGPPARRLTAALAMAPFVLTVLGAYLTRSGSAISVHGFAEDRAVGFVLLTLLAGVAGVSVALLRRVPRADRPPPRLFVLNHVLLAYAGAVVLFGTVFPFVASERIVVSPRFFSLFTAPAAAVAVVASLAALRRRRRPSVVVAHVGFAVLLAGVFGTTFGATQTLSLGRGETDTVAGHRVANNGWTTVVHADRTTLELHVEVDGRRVRPGLDTYPAFGQALPVVGMDSRPGADVLVVLRQLDRDNGAAVVDVFVRPLVALVWLGALLIAAGGTLALARPTRRRPTRTPDPPAPELSVDVYGDISPSASTEAVRG